MIINYKTMESTVKERLRLFLKNKKITGSDFCKSIDVSSGFIAGMRESIQPDKLKSIAINYPDLNIEWLLTGLGAMFKSDSASSNVQTGTINTNHQGTFHDVSTSIGGYSKLEEENEKLRKEVEELRAKVTTLQNQLLAEKDRVIEILSKGR